MMEKENEEFTFAANNSSDPREAREVIQGLKRIAKFGEHAKHVLKKLKEDGFYDGRAAYIENGYLGSGEYFLRVGSFPKIKKLTRAEIPEFGNYKLIFGDLQTNGYYHDNIPVSIVGPAKLKWNNGEITSEPLNTTIGYVKLLLNNFSIQHSCYSYGDSRTYKIYTRHDSAGGKEALNALGKNIAEKIIDYSEYDEDVPFILKDLRKLVPLWLEEDGLLIKFGDELREYANVQKIMIK